MNTRSCLAAGLTLMAALGLQARNYTWIGGTEGAWSTAANWVADDDSSVHAVPISWQDKATLSCADGDITITCSGYLEPAINFATNVTFYVAENKEAIIKGSFTGVGDISKSGPGKVTLNVGGAERIGWVYVNEGTLAFSAERALGKSGGCVVGDGVHDAVLEANRDEQWGGRFFGPSNTDGLGDLIIKNKGVLVYDKSNNWKTCAQLSNLTIEPGGRAQMGCHGFYGGLQASAGRFDVAGDMTFLDATSAALNGTFALMSTELRILGERTETFQMPVGLLLRRDWGSQGAAYAKLNAVGGNGLAVDLHVYGEVVSQYGPRDGLDIIGNGTVKLSGSSTYGGKTNGSSGEEGRTRVQSGRLLVDNTTGSGTGYSAVEVSAGATLGGIGIIGGLTEGKTYGNNERSASPADPCVIVNGAAGNPGVLAPGSYEDTTNARIYGTLTVGSAEAPSSVTMNANTKLAFEVGKGGATGLKVYGPLTLGTGVTLDVNVAEDAKSGDYVLVSATEGITGNYTLTGNVNPKQVVQKGNEIILRVRNGLTLIVR
jgi:hypothetical protein